MCIHRSFSVNHGVSFWMILLMAATSVGSGDALTMPTKVSETTTCRDRIRPATRTSSPFHQRCCSLIRLHASFTDESNAGSTESSSQKDEGNKSESTTTSERTLYEVLQVNPLATREEIKRSYFRLAKLSHPDALLDKPGNADGVDFQEIAEAWKVLGNTKLRRRYDRELTAKAWSLRAQAYTNERLEKAVPVVADMMDNIAVPFLRKTTATTWAVGQAIATGVSGFSRSSRKTTNQQRQQPAAAAAAAVPQTEEIVNGDQISEATSDPNSVSPFDAASSETQQNSNGRMSAPQQAYKTQARPIGLTDTFLQALEAGAQAAREIDSLELSEKSGQLEERAREEARKGLEIAKELDEVKGQRLFATIHSPDIALTASEAQEALERLHINDTVSIVDRAMLRHTIEEEIQSLSDAEEQFTEKLEVYQEADREWNQLLVKEEAAKEDLSIKKNKEIEARKVFDEAHQKVVEAKKELVTTSNELREVEEQVRKNAQEMDRITSTLAKKQQRVREALQKKTDLMKGGIQIQYLSEEDLTALRRREIQLIGESKQVAEMVARLESRAEKLKHRAEQLKNWQVEWHNVEKSGKLE